MPILTKYCVLAVLTLLIFCGCKQEEILLVSSLDEKNYIGKVYSDDETVNTRIQVKIEDIEVTNNSKLNLKVKSNNGFAIHIIQNNQKQ